MSPGNADRRFRTRGFTLLELLVALAILAVMSAFSYRAVSGALEAERRVGETSRQWLDLAVFFDQIEIDAMQAVARPVRDRYGTTQPAWILRRDDVQTDEARLEWTRLGEAAVAGSDSRRVAYRLVDGKLQLLHWPVLDRAPATEAQVMTVVGGIQAFKVRCLAADGRWLDLWPVPGIGGDLPVAIEIAVTLNDGSRVVRLLSVGGA